MNTTQQNAIRLSRKTSTPLTITEELYLVQLKDGSTKAIFYTKEVYEGRYDKRSAMLNGRNRGTQEHTATEVSSLPSVVRQLIEDLNSGYINDLYGIKTESSGSRSTRVFWSRVHLDYGFPESPMQPPCLKK